MKQLLFILFMMTAMIACQSNSTDTSNGAGNATEGETEQAAANTTHFGEMVSQDGAVSFEEMISQLEGQDSLEVKVMGKVDAVCQAKGCWMNIASATPGLDTMFVKFKDYGFFVPKHIAGRTVVMEGKVYREFTSVDELRHYAEDEGLSEEEISAITEPIEELKFMANGVLLLD